MGKPKASSSSVAEFRQCKDCGDTLRRKHEHKRCDKCHKKHRECKKIKCANLELTADALIQLDAVLQALHPVPKTLALNYNSTLQNPAPGAPVITFPGPVGTPIQVSIPLPFVQSSFTSSPGPVMQQYLPLSAIDTSVLVTPQSGYWDVGMTLSMQNNVETISFKPNAVDVQMRAYRGINPVPIHVLARRVMLPSGMGTIDFDINDLLLLQAGDRIEYWLNFDSAPVEGFPFSWQVIGYASHMTYESAP